jgi:hypothetical protein
VNSRSYRAKFHPSKVLVTRILIKDTVDDRLHELHKKKKDSIDPTMVDSSKMNSAP